MHDEIQSPRLFKVRRYLIITIIKLEMTGWEWTTQLNWTPSVTTHVLRVKRQPDLSGYC